MLPDVVSVVLRALSFVALFQAAGAAIFIAGFGRELTQSLTPIRQIGRWVAIAALGLAMAHFSLEAARMAGSFSGIADANLQGMVLHSSSAAMVAVRALGLVLIAIGIQGTGERRAILGVIGATLSVASFALIGHTAVHPARWILAVLLIAHLLIVAFWFGALLPLYVVSRDETSPIAAKVIDSFSRLAAWLVPAILLAGLAMAVILVPQMAVLAEPYGELLIAKIVGFALLMGLAAANKWRFGPAIARGDARAAHLFRRSVVSEFALIVAVLAVTAVMTAFFSPEHSLG